MEFTFIPAGDRALLVQFKEVISEEINREVIFLSEQLQRMMIKGVEEWVPAYSSLLIYYNPLLIRYDDLVNKVKIICEKFEGNEERPSISTVHEIPVLYGGLSGPDLDDVASFHQLSVEEVIRLHSSPLYHVYMIGFSPGFPYLGGLNPRIHTPRLATPRLQIKAGSVGIAGDQTGIYSLPTPGGWRIIGHTPIPLFQPKDEKRPTLISAGDKIKFVPVREEEYEAIKMEYQFSMREA